MKVCFLFRFPPEAQPVRVVKMRCPVFAVLLVAVSVNQADAVSKKRQLKASRGKAKAAVVSSLSLNQVDAVSKKGELKESLSTAQDKEKAAVVVSSPILSWLWRFAKRSLLTAAAGGLVAHQLAPYTANFKQLPGMDFIFDHFLSKISATSSILYPNLPELILFTIAQLHNFLTTPKSVSNAEWAAELYRLAASAAALMLAKAVLPEEFKWLLLSPYFVHAGLRYLQYRRLGNHAVNGRL
jgi:hypothetical protein